MNLLKKTIFPRLLALLFVFLCGGQAAMAQIGVGVGIENELVVCQSTSKQVAPPDFSSSDCVNTTLRQLVPKDQLLWVKATVQVPENLIEAPQPLGFYLFGKASSVVYFNGTLIGQNGTPGVDKQSERPGKMDAVFYLPRELVNVGENQVVIKLSGHHGFLDLLAPIHWIGLNTYAQPRDEVLRYYWRSLLPLGILILGVVYFGVAAARKQVHWLMPLMSLAAAGQLCVEVLRGLVAYPYPFHDVRLSLILLFSFCFGCMVLASTLQQFQLQAKARNIIFITSAALTALLVYGAGGFDTKSATAAGLPIIISLLLALIGIFKQWRGAKLLALSLSLFAVAVGVAPGSFLDVYLFYIVAGLLIVLFLQQLFEFDKQSRARAEEKKRGDKLQLIVDQIRRDKEALTLRVNHAAKTELVQIADIAYCKGAGDYVELALTSGATVLHAENLSNLEAQLPSTFLRVHRSYIVNTALITSLERKSSGVGVLLLSNGESVPVSRRVMPSVRERLA